MMNRLRALVLGILLGTLVAWISLPRIEATIMLWIPTSWWFEVSGLHVEDARVGETPRVRAQRRILRPITATRTSTLRRELAGPEDSFVTVCARESSVDYLPDSVLPPGIDLDWWMGIPPQEPCPPLEPGSYFLTTVWLLHVPGILPKEYRVRSNTFEVTPSRVDPREDAR